MISPYSNIRFNSNGVCEGVYYGQNERVDDLNHRIQDRQFPDIALPANYDPRPSSTKFCVFPTLDIRTKRDGMPTPIENDQTNGKYVYNPGSHRGPPNVPINNIDIETGFRKEYIPSSQSDLYNTRLTTPIVPSAATANYENTHPELFTKYTYSKYIPEYLAVPPSSVESNPAFSQKIGGNRFHNCTKTQLRGFQMK